jgi:hypothetical protein
LNDLYILTTMQTAPWFSLCPFLRKGFKEDDMELKDTVKGMMSDDYKERMPAEYHQTKIHYEKLKKLNTRISRQK